MKQGWTYKKLKEIGRTQTGTTPSKSVKSFYEGEIPFIRPAELDIDGNGSIEYNSELKLTPEGALKSRKISANSILMCCIGSVGKTGYAIKDVTCNQQINTVTPYMGYNGRFVYYALMAPSFQNEVKKIANSAKATLAIISKGKWEEMSIPVPPLSEQQSIVEYLDSAFVQIDELKSNAEKQLAEARALFQSALTQAMQPKPGWQCLYLEDVCSHIIDCPHTTPKKSSVITNYPCIRTSELKNGRIEWSTMQYLDKAEYEKRISRLEPKPNDIVYGREGTYGDAVILPEGYRFSLGQRTMLLRPNIKIVLPSFLHKQMISTHVYNQAKAKNSGCGVGHVNVKDIKRFILHVPSIIEQERIVENLDTLSNKVRELEEISRKTAAECDALKQALLRQIFE